LIESQKLRDIVNKLKEMYDMVIIDTPPVIAVNDATVVGRIADGILLVIESGRATFSIVDHIKELFTKAGLNTIGIVLNKFKAYEAGYYYYNRAYYK
jgi:Mrp family chromosome partitioning ATPase